MLLNENAKPNGVPHVKFDGFQAMPGGLVEVIDAKLSVPMWESKGEPVVSSKITNQIIRQSRALTQNPGCEGMIHVPNAGEKGEGTSGIETLGFQNLPVSVRPFLPRNALSKVQEGYVNVEVMIRRRAALCETKEAINARLVKKFVDLPEFWASTKIASDALLDIGEENATLVFRDALQEGIRGQVVYRARFPGSLSRDRATADDFMTLRIDPKKVDCTAFCRDILPKLLEIFGAYRAALRTDEKIILADHDRRVALYRGRGPDRDGRDGVERIWPVNFFDDVLCQRAFGIGAEEVVRRAKPECEHAEFILGGAFLIVTSDIVTGETALDALNARVMGRIDARAAA
jgi:hypothetical protein